jgi:pyruvate/2-oxoglutarate dehydrogenase complex dihydrolipoamide acyltransferase (E2) component
MLLSVAAATLTLQGRVQAQPASQAAKPSTKVELLFVQNATSGSFDGKTLTLKGVGPTLFFSDRPERIAGQVGTSDFVGHWTKGADNFAASPPNATLSIFGTKDVSSSVVVLTNPKLDRNTLSYTVKILEGKVPATFNESSLFIDILGRWRMAAMGMAIGEARGYQEGQAAAARPAAPAPAPAAPAPAPPRAAAPPASPAAPAPAAGLTASQAAAVAKLKQLKSLLDQGVITKSQYQEDSQKLLAEIVQ